MRAIADLRWTDGWRRGAGEWEVGRHCRLLEEPRCGQDASTAHPGRVRSVVWVQFSPTRASAPHRMVVVRMVVVVVTAAAAVKAMQ
ncbi:hypothetical protein GCM10027191_20630 [Novilysobacter erysipheiresistens]